MYDLSIIIANWNARGYLAACLRSIFEGTCGLNFEIIVVDNASSDGSIEMIKREFPKVKIISNKINLGFAKAINIGINHSEGEFLCLVNSDVKLLGGTLRAMISYMRQHTDVGILGPRVLNADLTILRNYGGFPTGWNIFCRALALDRIFPRQKIFGGYLILNRVTKVDVITGVFWLLRREALGEVGLLDESFFMYAEDMDLCRRFHGTKWSIVYFPEADVIHYGGRSSSNEPVRFYLEQHKSIMLYWKKFHSPASQICFSCIMLLCHIIRLVGWSVLLLTNHEEERNILLKRKREGSLKCILFFLGLLDDSKLEVRRDGFQHAEGVRVP